MLCFTIPIIIITILLIRERKFWHSNLGPSRIFYALQVFFWEPFPYHDHYPPPPQLVWDPELARIAQV